MRDEPGAYPGYFSRLTADWRENGKFPSTGALSAAAVMRSCTMPDTGWNSGNAIWPDRDSRYGHGRHNRLREVNDLHPVSKKPVGERRAMAAFQLAYGECGRAEPGVFIW